MLRGRPRVRRPARSCRSTRAACARRPGASATAGIRSVAVAAVFSPLNADVRGRGGGDPARGVPRTSRSRCRTSSAASACSSARTRRCSTPACIELARKTTAAFTEALRASGITAPLYLTQNDGTVMLRPRSRRRSRSTASRPGPTNSHAGGGVPLRRRATRSSSTSAAPPPTSAASRHGFPREANNVVEIGGVRTLFRMPDLLSIGLGGGTRDRDDGALAIGPRSVGYRLTEQALVFGGDDAHRHRRRGRRRPDRPRRPRAGGRAAGAPWWRRRSRASTP